MGDPIRRDRFVQELLNETLGRAVCVEAAGIATEKEITLEEALQEIREGIGLSRAEESSDWDRQPAEDRTKGRRQHQTDEPTAIRAIRRESSQYVSELCAPDMVRWTQHPQAPLRARSSL